MELMILMQSISDYESVGLKSLLIAAVLGLLWAVRYLYKGKETSLNAKVDFLEKIVTEKEAFIKTQQDSIIKLMEQHKQDYKEANNDYKKLLEINTRFMEQLRSEVIG